MPYKIIQLPNTNHYSVVNAITGKVNAYDEPSLVRAKHLVRILEIIDAKRHEKKYS